MASIALKPVAPRSWAKLAIPNALKVWRTAVYKIEPGVLLAQGGLFQFSIGYPAAYGCSSLYGDLRVAYISLFLERWEVMLELIREVDSQPLAVREKLGAIASFIIDSYRHDPDLMKVIIVEVTRAANSFGRTHLEKIREAYQGIANIVQKAQDDGTFKTSVSAQFAALAFYGAIEQVLTGWIFDLLPRGEEDYEQAKRFVVETVCGGLDAAPV